MKMSLAALAIALILSGCAAADAHRHGGMDHRMMMDNAMKWDGASGHGTAATCAMGSGATGKEPMAGGMCAMGPQQGASTGGMAMPQGGPKGGMQGCPMMAKSGQSGMPCCCGAMMKHGT